MIHKTNGLKINYLSFYGLGILILLLSLRDTVIFHQNHKDKDIFFKSGGNFKDWGYSDPPIYTPVKGWEHKCLVWDGGLVANLILALRFP